MTDGIAGLDFMDDIIDLFKDKWAGSGGGKLPIFTKEWKTKTVNFGGSEDKVIISLDGENPAIFSLKYADSDGNPIYDWLHTISISADVWTGRSETRALEMLNGIVHILKNNVTGTLGDNNYVQMLPVGMNPAFGEYKNIYRWVIDIEAMRLNPWNLVIFKYKNVTIFVW